MKDFFKMMFASTLGVIIASIILSVFSLVLFVGIAASFSEEPAYSLGKETVLRIDLNGVITDRKKQNPLDFLMNSQIQSSGLNDILSAIKKAKENDKIKGIYIKAGIVQTGYATMEPIRNALLDFKESGKFVVTYGDMFSQKAYYAASVSDKIFMNPQGMFDFMGLGASQQYNQEVFKKWGIDVQVFKVGTYKSAVEPYIQTAMSDANREQTTSYLNDIWSRILAGISESRAISVEQLNAYADECLAFSDPQKIVEYGLIDELAFPSEVEKHIKTLLKQDDDSKLKIATVKDLKTVPYLKKEVSKNKIAVLYAEGTIAGDTEAFMYGENAITAKEYVKELKKLQKDKNVKAVVFRVNSPGGSAFASEQILNAVVELKAEKPIIVSMGPYAASGGYYISSKATKIVAEPTTLTGSIGIFGLFPSGEQLAEKMGAHHDGVGTNKHSMFGSEILSIPLLNIGLIPAKKLNQEEMNLMQLYVERGYDLFLGHCADGRNMTTEEIDKIGQGRVWTGSQALNLGLVDALGGVDTAVKLAAEVANIEEYITSEYPAQKDFFTQLMEDSAEEGKIRFLKGILGSDSFFKKREIKAWQDFDCRQAIMEEFLF